MLKRVAVLAFAGALFVGASPDAAEAQFIWTGAGVAIPTGEFGDLAESGWTAVAGIGFPLGESGASIGIEGFYGQNNHDDTVTGVTDGDKTNPFGAMASLMYRIGNPDMVGPYVFGGGGLLVHRFSPETGESESDSNFGYQAGAGLDVPFGSSVGLWIEGRFMGASDTNFFGVLAGLAFGLG